MPETHVLAPKPKALPEAKEIKISRSTQAFRILQVAFVVAPIVAGLDKFFNVLNDWSQYLAPAFQKLSPFSTGHGTMVAIGVVEIIAGIIVAVRPRVGAWIVAAWLFLIMINLAVLGSVWDVVLRDLGLCLAAIALARLSAEHEVREARPSLD